MSTGLMCWRWRGIPPYGRRRWPWPRAPTGKIPPTRFPTPPGARRMPRPIRLQNELYTLEIDPGTGGVTKLIDRAGGYDLIGEPRLAEGFRLLLPIPGRREAGGPAAPGPPEVRCNYILSNGQPRPRVRRDGDAVELHWRGPLRSPHGSFRLAVTLRIALV